MSYTSYGSQITGKLSNLNTLIDDISDLDLSSLWQGVAYDKQNSVLNNTKTALNTQVNQLDNLVKILSKVDEYDKLVDDIDNYTSQRNVLNSSDSNYNSEYTRLSDLIRDYTTKRNDLKININNLLSELSDNYSQQVNIISNTEMVSTIDIFNDANEYFIKLDSGFDMNNTVIPFFTSVINDSNKNPNFDNKDAWISKNPYSYSYTGQCTWFAWGRFYEIYGYSPGFTTNGNGCVNQLIKAHGDKFVKSSTPIAGAVFSTGLNETYGHVGIVLEVDEANDKIVIQDGNYNGSSDSFAVAKTDWGTKTLSLREFLSSRGGPVFANPIGEEAVMNV